MDYYVSDNHTLMRATMTALTKHMEPVLAILVPAALLLGVAGLIYLWATKRT